MFASVRKSPERLEVIERVTEWTRERFKLPKETVISVSEIACPLPGCPPLETVVLFWIAERPQQFKLFKPVAEVVQEDLPPAWLKDGLAVSDDFDCGCC
jgi:nitrate reductase delta subunit